MKFISRVSVLVSLAMALLVFQLKGTEALAQSSYFTSQGCSGCHSAPTVATCNGCHAHGTHASSAKSGINVTGTTSKTSYAPGETVSVTIAGGYRTGWVRAVLYNQNTVELARSTGNDSGMGSSTTFPGTLSAPAPTTPGTYAWKVAWYGNQYDAGSATIGSGWTADPTNPGHGAEIVNTNSFTVAAPADTTAPTVSTFTVPTTFTSLSVTGITLTATDSVGVTGYQLTETATSPLASAAGWSVSAPASYTFATAGVKTLYAWAKDAAGNVSLAKSAAVTITLPDTTVPVVSVFTLPATATSLNVPVSAFTATDNIGVTGYLITTSATAPTSGWLASSPTSVTATAAGSTTFYAWANDAAGNVSAAKSAAVTITLPDTTAPVVGVFTLPATATSLNVPVSAFTATDNIGVTGYLITTSATAPTSGWLASSPTSVTAAAAGSTTFYAWANDAAGNVSLAKSAAVTITLPDTTVPVVSVFTLPATATSLNVPVSAFTATDNIGVTGYLITTSATAPTSGWLASSPTSVTATAAGSTTFYAWAKDAAGNVSAAKSTTVTITLPDTTVPVVSVFTLPATATSLNVPVSAFTATDNIGVTGYLITTSATAPTSGWLASSPTSVTAAAAGSTTFYAWANDAAGNVSLAKSAAVTITLPDTTVPVVSVFTLPATATSLNVPVSAFTATDNIGVTGYLITTSATAPTSGWLASSPTSVTATAAGSTTFYAWAKDAAGNVSAAKSTTVTITLPDTTVPVVSVFTLPATATSLNVPVSAFTATDNIGVTGYLITTSATAPTSGWLASSPTSVTAAAAGSTTFYAWANDAAGNVSLAKSAAVTITLPDTTVPVVSVFTLPATATSLNVPVSAFTATDNIGVTGYLITTSATAPTSGWLASSPTSVTATAAGSTTFYAWAKDAAGNVSAAKSTTVTITLPDTTVPVVSVFTLPATATSLNVPVSAFTATDNIGVTGYLITTSATAPTSGWLASSPTSVTAAAAGSTTFYAWANDAAGNVSLAKSTTVTITLPDTTVPVVSVFTLPATATSLNVPVSAFTATDNIGVTGYLITTSATAPTSGWLASSPTSVTATAAGSTTFYAWAKDAAGNVSAAKSTTVTITLPDTTVPVVSVFTLPATATSLNVPVSAFTATDNIGVTGYLITTSATAPTSGWLASSPTSVTAAAAGSTTFYAWANDAAGNVSLAKSAAVTITLPDTTVPVVSGFTLPATATSLNVPVSAFTATDNIGVTGYLITTSATAPSATSTSWTASAQSNVTAAGTGTTTFYAWAKDAAGNVSAVKSASVTITLPDTTAPVVGAFTLPASATSLTVPVSSLIATDNVAVTGYIITTSATAPAASTTGWSVTAPTSVTAAAAGINTFYAWANDAAGNVSAAKSASVTIIIATDTTNPTLTISALGNGSYTNQATLNVSGNASDTGGIKSVTVNDNVVPVNLDGSFSYALTLTTGANTITSIATDNADNQQIDTRTVTYDPNAPVLAVSAPTDNSTTTMSFITLSGTINETSMVSVSVNNGSPQSAAITGNTYSATVYLTAGVNTINIVATDLAGNSSTAKRTVTYTNSSNSLALAVTYPSQDITTRNPYLVLMGKVVDQEHVTVKITMNGKTYTPEVDDGVFKQRLTFTTSKLYAITVTATDNVGNTSTVFRNVIYRSGYNHDDD